MVITTWYHLPEIYSKPVKKVALFVKSFIIKYHQLLPLAHYVV